MLDTLALPDKLARPRKNQSPASSRVNSTPNPWLSGRYEVLVPGQPIFFTDSLLEAAEHLASARWGRTAARESAKTQEVFSFLESVEQMGGLGPGEYGVRVHRNQDDGSPWIAKVRGTQSRAQPKYAIDDYVQVFDATGPLPSHLYNGREVRVCDVIARNDIRPGKQYAYTVSGGGAQALTEDRVRPRSAAMIEPNFDGFAA